MILVGAVGHVDARRPFEHLTQHDYFFVGDGTRYEFGGAAKSGIQDDCIRAKFSSCKSHIRPFNLFEQFPTLALLFSSVVANSFMVFASTSYLAVMGVYTSRWMPLVFVEATTDSMKLRFFRVGATTLLW